MTLNSHHHQLKCNWIIVTGSLPLEHVPALVCIRRTIIIIVYHDNMEYIMMLWLVLTVL